MTFAEILPIITYILVIVLLIVLIVLGIKLIFVVDKADKFITDIQRKLGSFDTVFKLIDLTSEKLTYGVSNLIESIVGFINRLFKKRKEEREYE